METVKKNLPGILVCLAIAIPSYILGKFFPVIGGAVFSILAGMIIATFWTKKGVTESGIKFTSKFILQLAVVLLGFGLNLNVIMQTGRQSLPIIVCTIATSLIMAFLLHKWLSIHENTSILIGVGSSICGGSAIAATAPVINADDEEVAQSISVIFFFNVLAAIIFPILGKMIGFDTTSGDAFGIFAGTAVNDTSSVTAAAATWDSMWNLGTATLDKAVTVKLTRTLAIIPITLALAAAGAKKLRSQCTADGQGAADENPKFSIKQAFPMFILYFVLASIVTTVAANMNIDTSIFAPLKTLSKFFIVMAMAAIGLNSNIVKLVRTGGKPLILGASCWLAITLVSILMQHFMGIF
ncbi:MAG: YeiH family protein [Eubacterium sp.]|nr:YeiH family protein [Eubacterium sp.]